MRPNPKKHFKNKSDLKTELLINRIEASVGRKLQDLYPGYSWQIECKPFSGVVEVKNLTIHGDYGFLLHLKMLVHDTNLELVKQAGGELLERCGLPATLRPENMESYVKRDIRGNVEMDTHGAT